MFRSSCAVQIQPLPVFERKNSYFDCSMPYVESTWLFLHTASLFELKRCKDLNGKRAIPKRDLCGKDFAVKCAANFTLRVF